MALTEDQKKIVKKQMQKTYDRFVMSTPLLIMHWLFLAMIIYGILGIITCWNSIAEISKQIDYYYFRGPLFLDPLILICVFGVSFIHISLCLTKHYFTKKVCQYLGNENSKYADIFDGFSIDVSIKEEDEKKDEEKK